MTANTLSEAIASQLLTHPVNSSSDIDSLLTAIAVTLGEDPDAALHLLGLRLAVVAAKAKQIVGGAESISNSMHLVHRTVSSPTTSVSTSIISDIRRASTAGSLLREELLGRAGDALALALSESVDVSGLDGEQLRESLLDRLDTIERLISEVAADAQFASAFIPRLQASPFRARLSARTVDGLANLTPSEGLTNSSLISIALELALLDTFSRQIDPLDYKYAGGITVQDGGAAKITSAYSLPTNNPTNQVISLSIDSTPGTLTVEAAVPPSLTASPTVITTTGTPAVAASAFPLAADSGISVLVGNTRVNLTTVGTLADMAALVSFLDSGLDAYDVSCSLAGTSTIQLSGDGLAGSNTRLAFYNNAATGTTDLNDVLDLTYTDFGEARGIGSASLVVASLPSGTSVTSEAATVLSGSGVLSLSGSDSVIAASATNVLAGDVVLVGESTYSVKSATSTSITLDGEVLYGFDGAALTNPYGSSVTYEVRRAQVTVTSPSTAWGVTEASTTAPNFLGFPATGDYSSGEHRVITLQGQPVTRPPIRVGDAIESESGLILGTVAAVPGSGTISVALVPGRLTLPSSSIRIRSQGAVTYGPTVGKLGAIARYSATDTLVRTVRTYMFSGSGRQAALAELSALSAYATSLQTAALSYKWQATATLTSLLSALNAAGATLLRDALLELDVDTLINSTAASHEELLRGAIGSVALGAEDDDEFASIHYSKTTWDQEDAADGLPQVSSVEGINGEL